MFPVYQIDLVAQVLPPKHRNADAGVYSASFGTLKGYCVVKDGETYHVYRTPQPGCDPEGVISIPASYVKRVEYLSCEQSPVAKHCADVKAKQLADMAAKVKEAADAAAAQAADDAAEAAKPEAEKRGPGRPRVHPLPTSV